MTAVDQAPPLTRKSNVYLFTTMLISSLISLTASLVLSIDAIALAANPGAELSCNISSAISCGKVGVSWQANLLGFPNAYLGLIAEPVVITIAVASLAKVKFPRGFMFAAQVVYTIGLLFAFWLFYQSMTSIGALCPWCLLVTLSTTGVFVSMTHVNIRDNNLFLSPAVHERLCGWLRIGIDTLLVVLVITVMVALVFLKYGSQLWS